MQAKLSVGWTDKLPDQELANKFYDNPMNMGMHRTVLFLQSGLKFFNRNQQMYADIV